MNNIEAAKILVSLAVSEPEAVDETDNVRVFPAYDVLSQEGWSALLNAAQKGHYEIIKILLENGASVDLPDLVGFCRSKGEWKYSDGMESSNVGSVQKPTGHCDHFTTVQSEYHESSRLPLLRHTST